MSRNSPVNRVQQLRRYNRYQDIEINADLLPHDEIGKFLRALRDEECKWLSRLSHRVCDVKVRTSALFWLKIPVRLSHLLPSLLCNNTFTVHHGTTEYIMAVKGPGATPTVSAPLYGTHYSRVECVVLDREPRDVKQCSVLIIDERVGTMDSCRKLITGSVNPGEYISAAAIRESLEECDIRCRFLGVLGMVNRIATRFNRDEILVGCCLVVNPPGQVPVPHSDEIKGAQWLPFGEAVTAGNYMCKHWLESLLAVPPMIERNIEDYRGHGHKMMIYSNNTPPSTPVEKL
jgi:8-oxo-dGTP pyrophosphatase MutT (NUDIX family)